MKPFRDIYMKIELKYFLMIGALLMFSCSSDDECSNTEITLTDLEAEYGCTSTKYQMDIDLTNDFTIIRTQSSFDDLVTGNCSPQIDFDRFDLIIGKQVVTTGNVSLDYKLMNNCVNNRLDLTITSVQGLTTVVENLTYHVLVPKLNDKETVDVVFTVIEAQ